MAAAPIAPTGPALFGFTGPIVRKYTLKNDRPTPSSSRLDYDRALNAQQREVVRAGGGPLLVIAGAGSGKTHTLTWRVAHLIERGVDPSKILLLTFTNKAARAMTDRVMGLLGAETQAIWSGTFHSIANRILRHDGHLLGYPRDFTILDGEDAQILMRACAADADVPRDMRLPQPRVLVRIHSMCINTQQDLEQVLADQYSYFSHQSEEIRAILRLYQSRKLEMALMDFDDLLLLWLRLLSEHPEALAKWSGRFEHILVDEYQDTNHLQGAIVDLMASRHGNLMAVGDDCQSIYAFRGADYRNILEFPDRYPGCQQLRLEVNYRSTPEILDLANRSIAHNTRQFHKTLQANRMEGPRPALIGLRDVYQQAEFVCQRILDLIDEGTPLRDIAVLYRAHHHSMELQVELTRRNIPYIVRSGVRFFEQAHIKDTLSYLRFVFNPRDELSFMRLSNHWRDIGVKRAQQLWAYIQSQPDPLIAATSAASLEVLPARAAKSWKRAVELMQRLHKMRQGSSPGAMIEAILAGGYRDVVRQSFEQAEHRLGDLEQLANYAGQYDSLDGFLSEISLLTTFSGQEITSGGEAADEYICLTSIHQAKGLEWGTCFVLWLADGQFPSRQSVDSLDEMEEERRLFYVATTRAKDDLYLCHPFTYHSRDYGLTLVRPSEFIQELETPEAPEEEPWERWVIEQS